MTHVTHFPLTFLAGAHREVRDKCVTCVTFPGLRFIVGSRFDTEQTVYELSLDLPRMTGDTPLTPHPRDATGGIGADPACIA